MKVYLLVIALNFANVFCQGQSQKNIVLLTVKPDRAELARAVKFLNANTPKLIAVNVDLFECDQRKNYNSSLDYRDHVDSLAVRSEIYPSEAEKELSVELRTSEALLMPSQLRPLRDTEYTDVVGCGFLYPHGVTTGFINLISDENIANQAEKFQVSINDASTDSVSYHFAVNIALAMSAERTNAFIKAHPNVISIDFYRERKFDTYRFDDIMRNKKSKKNLNGKVVIISMAHAGENFLIRRPKSKDGGLRKMSTAEIFANIACQIIGE